MSRVIYIYITFTGKERDLMIYKKNTFRRAAAAAAAICLAFAFAFADKTGADKLGFGTSVTVSAADLVYDTGTTAKLYYTVKAYGEITITKVIPGSETRIDVPASIDGKKVTAIENQAFANCATLESITLPESISGISKDLFKGCTSLKIVFLCQNTYTYDGAVPEGTTEIQYAYDSSTGGMAIVKGKSNGQTSIDIPETICGQKVTTIGTGAFYYYCQNVTSFTLPQGLTVIENNAFSDCSSLTDIVIPDSVTEIEATAFSNCTALESITLSQNIKEIRNGTFYNCTALKSIEMPLKLKSIENSAFQGCSALTNVTLPESVTSIGERAFQDCSALKSINIPKSVTIIEYCLFYNCSALTDITLPNGVTSIGSYAFNGCSALESINIPDSVTEIQDEAFGSCSSIETMTLPTSVTRLGNYVFSECTSLKTVFLPQNAAFNEFSSLSPDTLNIFYAQNSPTGDMTVTKVVADNKTSIELPEIVVGGKVTAIGAKAFSSCYKAQEIKLPGTVTEIGSAAFYNCFKLKNVDIPQSVYSIGANAFENCIDLETVIIPSGVVSMGDYSFQNCSKLKIVYLPDKLRSTSINNNATRIYYTMDSSDPSENKSTVTKVESGIQTDIVIPETISGAAVNKIGKEAFSNYSNLKSVALPDGITSIGEKAFSNCSDLTSINIPDSVETIGAYAFENCTSLPSIDLPDNGKLSIGAGAFLCCRSIESIVIPDNIITLEKDLFVNCEKLRSITVPDGITSIGDYAFYGCSALSAFKFPADLKTIGEYSFNGCYSLKSIDLPNKLTAIGQNAFAGCEGLTSVTLPDSVTDLGTGVFECCYNLVRVTLPKDLTVLNSALFHMTNLKSIVIPESVTQINDAAFANCRNLESIELPPNVTYVADMAFEECYGLRNVFYNTKTDISQVKIYSSAKTKYEIRNNLAYILEVVPDSSNTPVVINDTLCGYEVMSTTEEYRQYVSETGHTHKGGTATCTETAHCAICGTSYNSIDPSNHDADTKTWKYDENGHWNPCLRTGCEEHLNAAAHTFDDGVITTEPTDTTDGVRTYTCKVCGYEKTEAVSKRGHNPSDKWTYDSENHWKECTTEGCGEKLDTAAHSFDDGVITTEPTDTTDGVKTYTCKVCGYEKTEAVSKRGHNPSDKWTYDSENHWKECTTEGCGEKLDTAAHSFDDGVITTEPTDTTDGVKTYTCKVCGYEKTEAVSKRGHNPSDKWTYDSENHWKECTTEGCDEKLDTAAHTFDDGVVTTAPTETAEGIKTYTCTVCGYEKTESIEKLPSKPAAVIYPISISGDVTADKSSATAGETVTVSAPFGYDIIITDINGRQIAKITEKGSFNMPASRVTVTAVRGETFIHMSNAWNHSYVYSYDSDMNRIKVNSDTRRGTIVIDLGADNAGRSFTLYSGRKSTSKKILSGTLDENGRYIFKADEGKNYTLVVE